MTEQRINELLSDYTNAMTRLKEALLEDPKSGALVIDGTIQRFEFTFELSWKLMRAVLLFNAVQVDAPRGIIKEAFRLNIINNGDGWINMLEDRNQTSHIYDQQQAMEIYIRIKDNHFNLLNELITEIKKFIK